MSQLRLITTVSIHPPDIKAALAIGRKNYVPTIGRHRWTSIIASIDSQLLLIAAIRIRDPEIQIPTSTRCIDDLVVGGPSNAFLPVEIAEGDLRGAARFFMGCNPDISVSFRLHRDQRRRLS